MKRIFDLRKNEARFRRLLRLEGELADPIGYDFVPAESGYLRMEKVEDEEKARRWAAWHNAPRRAHLAHETARRLSALEHRTRDRLDGLKYAVRHENSTSALLGLLPGGKLERLLLERALREARVLQVKSYYISPPVFDEFEGYIELGHGLRKPLVFASRSWLEKSVEQEREMGEEGETVQLPGGCFSETVFVDLEHLDEESLKAAITHWYCERYRWTPGHWTQPQGRGPLVRLDVSFADEAPSGMIRAIAL